MSIKGNYDETNIFNRILLGEEECVEIYEDDCVLAFMDIFPESEGHTLIVPKVKSRNFLDMPQSSLGHYMTVLQRIAMAINEALEPDGIRIMQYNGALASQTVFHTHFHIVPCYEGKKLIEHNSVRAEPETLKLCAEQIKKFL